MRAPGRGVIDNWARVSVDVSVQQLRDPGGTPGGQHERSRIEKELGSQGSGSETAAPSALGPGLRSIGVLYLSSSPEQFEADPRSPLFLNDLFVCILCKKKKLISFCSKLFFF